TMPSRIFFFFFSSRRRHTRFSRDWSSDVCSSDLLVTWFSWRWAFGIPALAAIVVVSAAPRLLTRGPKKAGGGVSPDLDTSHGPEIGRASSRERACISNGCEYEQE